MFPMLTPMTLCPRISPCSIISFSCLQVAKGALCAHLDCVGEESAPRGAHITPLRFRCIRLLWDDASAPCGNLYQNQYSDQMDGGIRAESVKDHIVHNVVRIAMGEGNVRELAMQSGKAAVRTAENSCAL